MRTSNPEIGVSGTHYLVRYATMPEGEIIYHDVGIVETNHTVIPGQYFYLSYWCMCWPLTPSQFDQLKHICDMRELTFRYRNSNNGWHLTLEDL